MRKNLNYSVCFDQLLAEYIVKIMKFKSLLFPTSGVKGGVPPAYYGGLVGHESPARPCGEVVSHSQTSPGTATANCTARAWSLQPSCLLPPASCNHTVSCSWKKGEVFDAKSMGLYIPGLFLPSEVTAAPLLYS